MSKKDTGHSPVVLKRIPYAVCRKCGLIYLKNDATRKAINKPCKGTPDDD